VRAADSCLASTKELMMTVFQVEKMTCNGCARHVTKAIQSIQSAAQVNVDLASGKVEVTPSPADPAVVAKAITEAGYPARPVA
jgi:Cu+-exporting ATPase